MLLDIQPPVRSALNPGATEARRPRPVYGKMAGGWRSGGGLCWRATCQGIANRKLIEMLWAGVGECLPRRQFPRISIDFPMPRKTHVGILKIAARSQRPFCHRVRHAWYAVRLLRLASRAVGPFQGAPFYNASSGRFMGLRGLLRLCRISRGDLAILSPALVRGADYTSL